MRLTQAWHSWHAPGCLLLRCQTDDTVTAPPILRMITASSFGCAWNILPLRRVNHNHLLIGSVFIDFSAKSRLIFKNFYGKLKCHPIPTLSSSICILIGPNSLVILLSLHWTMNADTQKNGPNSPTVAICRSVSGQSVAAGGGGGQ